MTTRVLVVNEGPEKSITVATMGVNTLDPAAADHYCKVDKVDRGQHAEFYVYDNQYLVVKEFTQ